MLFNKIIQIPVVESTNNYVANMMNNSQIAHGTVILAEHQTNGKGQREAKWESEANKNLTFSLFLKNEPISIVNGFYLNKIISISLINLLISNRIFAKIKWPNDIYVLDKKIAGILIENNIKNEKIDSSIIGVGLNVNQFSFNIHKATSMKKEKNIEYDLRDLLYLFLDEFQVNFSLFESKNFKQINELYIQNLYLYNEWAIFQDKTGIWEGKIFGVDEFGCLQIENRKGEMNTFLNKEINFLF
ncbi:MAG: biotin--[acetyl-CoA-carboxylase] ligase [Flavobacteriia bacterium]|nr:biotin--[acetyl-CoA-carboxylase] ligase [Flavobacteriia bacterium]